MTEEKENEVMGKFAEETNSPATDANSSVKADEVPNELPDEKSSDKAFPLLVRGRCPGSQTGADEVSNELPEVMPFDRELVIARGNNSKARTWKPEKLTFAALCERLKETKRTTESAEEYRKMSKEDRDRAKDQGGFVGGALKDNRRLRQNVLFRSLITMDADSAEPDFIARFESTCPWAAVLYSTHSHTPEQPRVRLVIPLRRDITPDEYQAVSRYIGEFFGIEQFDECSYRLNQMMYWPTSPSDGEYRFLRIEKPWLDPDAFLEEHPGWEDCANLPVSSREQQLTAPGNRQREDPLQKSGTVGVFCRTYTVQSAMDTFLPDLYAPSSVEGRYDYIPGEGHAGVVVYDSKFFYSHHATDPAGGRLLNAFELVQLHRFGEDSKAFGRMTAFAVKQDAVKLTLARERENAVTVEGSGDGWKTGLEYDRFGSLLDSLDNLVLILTHDEGLQNIAYNGHRDSVVARGDLPWDQLKEGWSDSDSAALKVYIARNYGLYSPAKTRDALLAVAVTRRFHPIRDYFASLPAWDGVPRVETLFRDYFGSEDNSYTRAVCRKFLSAAVARVYQPGIKFDSVPILNGPQGIGKSTFFARLAGEWFSDSLTLTDMKDKAGPEKLQGYWILELGELAGMRKMDVEVVKSFLSRTDDKFRVSYGVNVESHPRQCIIVGTTNAEAGFLRDITGNRRFWPVRTPGTGAKKAWEMTKQDVDQIWAEALLFYQKGEPLYMEGEDALLAGVEQMEALESDDREGLVRQYLDRLLPENWASMSVYDRRNFLSGSSPFSGAKKGTVKRTRVCNLEIWCECFGQEPSELRKQDSYEISSIMMKVEGWKKIEKSSFGEYGRCRGYERKEAV